MREAKGNIWTVSKGQSMCIMTNGVLKTDGRLVMGAGIAKQASERFPGLADQLGKQVRLHGNRVHYLGTWGDLETGWTLYSFPTKHHWRNPSDINLIRTSAEQLVEMVDLMQLPGEEVIYLTRPGCGCGQLNWPDVREVLASILDDRFVVVSL